MTKDAHETTQNLTEIPRFVKLKQRGPTKADQLLKLLARSKGATITEIEAQLAWQPYTIRAVISRLRAAGRDIKPDRSGKTARYFTAHEVTQ
ncbi:MAG: DUF3489 domain-containing protein [Pseudomonadota bacterium]